jgi:dihydrodipicolinate reductase
MKIAVAGAAGRMGQMLVREIARTEGATLAGALEGSGSTAKPARSRASATAIRASRA